MPSNEPPVRSNRVVAIAVLGGTVSTRPGLLEAANLASTFDPNLDPNRPQQRTT